MAWHLVGGLDAIDAADLTGGEPDDGHPVLLAGWNPAGWLARAQNQTARQ